MQKFKYSALAVLLFFAVLPLQAQKKTQPTSKPKAAPAKPTGQKPAASSNPKKTEEEEEKADDLLPPPQPKPPLNPAQPFGRIVLLPMDDRPANTQIAQMVGAIADFEVITPPKEMLGRFTTAGDTKKIQTWLSIVDYTKVDAVIISADMLAYGGLIASRTANTTPAEAMKQLEFLRWLKHKYPDVRVYVSNVLMRIAPTASAATRTWRDDLARWAELMDRAPKTNDAKLSEELAQLKKKLDRNLIDDYLSVRRRDLQLNLALIKLYEEHVIDQLIFLQDDARAFGLHRHDQVILHERLKSLGFEDEVLMANGADTGSLSLVSRAVLDKTTQKIKVGVVYSSENGRKVIAPAEDHPLEFVVEQQIIAAGGHIAKPEETPDYTLYINAPGTNEAEFKLFSQKLVAELKAEKAVAVADVCFPAPHQSGADERLIRMLKTENLLDHLAGYAAWNTADNTLSTVIPAANLRVFSKQLTDAPERAARANVAYLEFLLQRFANDYFYQDIVRFDINAQLRKPPALPSDEFTEEIYNRVNKQVQEKLQPLIEKFFAETFQGKSYSLGLFNSAKREIKINSLKGLKISLPWPRTVESAIEYKFDYKLN